MFDQLKNQQYINVETFRKNGLGVKTPVWFVLDGEIIYVQTIADSAKVKRIRNNGSVNIAPCKADGTTVGDWSAEKAIEVIDPAVHQKVNQLLDRKYGLMKKLFGISYAIQGKKSTILKITN